MKLTLGLTGLLDYFAGRIYSTTEVERGKPEADLFLYAAEQSGVAPSRCVVIDDSRSGVQAARTVEWRGHDIGRGRKASPHDEVKKRWPESFE
jgi:HAD superfamily hydrolase (TIGR01509 family)